MDDLTDAALEDQLWPEVYDALRLLAHRKLRYERSGHTLNTTGLVHEVYLKMADQRKIDWQNRTHFFALAAQAMRRILVDYANARKAAKRGGGISPLSIDRALEEGVPLFSDERPEDVLALDEALRRMAVFNERGARVVEYRFFGGLTHQEIAVQMGLSEKTIRRIWTASKSWLRQEMRG